MGFSSNSRKIGAVICIGCIRPGSGMAIGFLFGLDFLFLYWGIAFTTASRSTIFLYNHPFWVALGAHFVVQGDRLIPAKVLGLPAFTFQVFVIAFFSYVLWFWIIIQFPVSKLTAFTFLAPLFGVIMGSVLLAEPVTPLVWLGMVLVGGGIYVINRPPRKNRAVGNGIEKMGFEVWAKEKVGSVSKKYCRGKLKI